MNEAVRKRKSIRKYEKTALSGETFAMVRGQIARLAPLYPAIQYFVQIEHRARRLFTKGIAAPYFLVFRSEDKNGAQENTGFIGQQMDLFFSENGIGSCWLGKAKPDGKDEMPYVISIAFGKAAEPLHRALSELTASPCPTSARGTTPGWKRRGWRPAE